MIHILDDLTIDKIAAGEVVERPASVIKELVENAMDANSTMIEIEIMAGGTSLMRVTDNGCGMDRENARLAILRHATSKINSVDDLLDISSLGFRGEALPSIAAVSRFTMLTRLPTDDLGTIIKISGGAISEIDDIGTSIGTTIRVEDLFFNIPARKKFLKTTHTEGNKINEIVIKLALSRPDISFKFINNNKIILQTPGNNNLFDTIEAIYGTKIANELLPIEMHHEIMSVEGFITKPAIIRSSRSWQTLIINGRIVNNRAISRAVDNAYHSLLPKSGYPLLVLKVQLNSRDIDINVHPQKAEIKIDNESELFKLVYAAIVDAVSPKQHKRHLDSFAIPISDKDIAAKSYNQGELLSVSTTSPTPQIYLSNYFTNNYHQGAPMATIPDDKLPGSSTQLEKFREIQSQILNEKITDVSSTLMVSENNIPEVYYPDHSLQNSYPDEEAYIRNAHTYTPLGQIDNCFIIAQDPQGGMFLIDQHAAHERILYDKFAKQADSLPSQALLVHIFMDVAPEEIELCQEHATYFQDLGFHLDIAGDNLVRITKIPVDIKAVEAEAILRSIWESLTQLHSPTKEQIRHACLAMTACKAAIKAGDVMNISQIKILLNDLSQTRLPYTCPHGRPTIIHFSSYDLAKIFKRVN